MSLLRDDLKSFTPCCFSGIPNRVMEHALVIAIALRRLSSGNTVRGVGEGFGVSSPTVSKCVVRFCNSVLKILAPIYLTWPTITERESIKSGFEAIKGFKNCIGAIDCTHVYMKSPSGERAGDYRDRNN